MVRDTYEEVITQIGVEFKNDMSFVVTSHIFVLSRHTYERVMSCHMYERVIPRHTYEGVMSRHNHDGFASRHTYEGVM